MHYLSMNLMRIVTLFLVLVGVGVSYANAESLDYASRASFLQAVSKNDLKKVQDKISQNKTILTATDELGNNALMFAAVRGHTDMVRLLMTEKINLNSTNKKGQTALHYAVKYQQADILKLLVDGGANTHIKDAEGKTALNYAMDSGALNMAQLIDPKSVVVETNEVGLPMVAIAAAAGGGGGVSATAVAAGAAVVAGGAGIAVAAGGGGSDKDSGGATATTTPPSTPSTPPSSKPDNTGGGNNGGGQLGGRDESNPNNYPVFYKEQYASGGNLSVINYPVNTSLTGKNIRVALLDTGVFFNHSDLTVDKSLSFDTQSNTHDATPALQTGNINESLGTAIAGVIAAKHNGFGIDGVAPDAQIVSIRLPFMDIVQNSSTLYGDQDYIDTTSETMSENIQKGLNYAMAKAGANASIINQSGAVLDILMPTYALHKLGCNDSPMPAGCSDLFLEYSKTFSDTYSGQHYQERSLQVPNGALSAFLTLPHSDDRTFNAIHAIIDTYQAIGKTNKVMVWPAGDYGYTEVQMDARLPFMTDTQEFQDLRENWLVVGALGSKTSKADNSRKLSESSNKCGIAKTRCLVAPGALAIPIEPNGIYVEIENTSNEYEKDGVFYDEKAIIIQDGERIIYRSPKGYAGNADATSLAASQVSGALALLLEQTSVFRDDPRLAAEHLLKTANREFDDYKVQGADTYGQGILDITKALAPDTTHRITVATQPTASYNTILLTDTRISFGAATGDALSRTPFSFGIVDHYKRLYQMPVQTPVYDENLVDRWTGFSDDFLQNKQEVAKNLRLAVSAGDNERNELNDTMHRSITEIDTLNAENQKTSSRWALSFDDHTVFSDMNYNVPFDKAFGFSTLRQDVSHMTVSDAAGRNPFLGFAETGMSVVSGYRAHLDGNTTTFKMGGFLANSNSEVETLSSGKEASNSGVVGQVDQTVGERTRIGLQLGLLVEKNSFLGSYTSGAFSVAKGTPTWFSGLAGEYAITDHTRLFGTYSVGLSKPAPYDGSLVTDVSDIVSDSFSVGVSHSHLFDKNDESGFVVSQPLRVRSGSTALRLATGKDENDTLYYSQQTLSLQPSGREIDGEVYYGITLSDAFKVKTSLMYRSQPNHVSTAPGEGVGLISVRYAF